MASLTPIEKRKLEELFGMNGGYVLDFSNRTFEEFFRDTIEINIYADAYGGGFSGSKANRLRAFWTVEPDHIVARLLEEMIAYAKALKCDPALTLECAGIIERLKKAAPLDDLSELTPSNGGRDFEALSRSIRDSIAANKPEAALDRLHTFIVKYVRSLCAAQGIETGRDKPLHSIFGEYVKSLKDRGLMETEMSERILKSNIRILEAFNDVRNNGTLAHDNPLVNTREALFIFANVGTVMRFLSEIERAAAEKTKSAAANANEDDEWAVLF